MLARLVGPTSKADTIRVLQELGVPAPSLETIWRTLAQCIEHNRRVGLCKAAYSFSAAKHGGRKLGRAL